MKSFFKQLFSSHQKCKISGIYLINNFSWNEFLPWRQSLKSAQSLADDLIIVKGNNSPIEGNDNIDGFLKDFVSQNENVRVVEHDWHSNYSLFEVAHALNHGLTYAKGTYIFKMYMDEYLPKKSVETLREMVRKSTSDLIYANRNYCLGHDTLYPYISKIFLFRNNRKFIFGRQSEDSSHPLLVDEPVILDNKLPTDFSYEDYLELSSGGLIVGTRDFHHFRKYSTSASIINTDTTFLPDELMKVQKIQSKQMYQRLPKTYSITKSSFNTETIIEKHIEKVKNMAESDKVFSERFDDELANFIRQMTHVNCLSPYISK